MPFVEYIVLSGPFRDWVSYALLHKCVCIPLPFCFRGMQPCFSSGAEGAVAVGTRLQRIGGSQEAVTALSLHLPT